MVTRRQLFATAAAPVLCTCRAWAQRIAPRGCVLTAEEADRLEPVAAQLSPPGLSTPIPHSSDRLFDRALAQSLYRLSEVLAVVPGFGFYDDYDGPNAYALPQPRLGGVDGTVLFGLRFLEMLRRVPENPEVGVLAVCAHEFGHILQFKHGLWRSLVSKTSSKRLELQADYFSGYFTGTRRLERPAFPAAHAALAHFRMGDTAFNSANHHGTPDERGAAFVRGYEVAFQQRHPLNEAIQIGMAYAINL